MSLQEEVLNFKLGFGLCALGFGLYFPQTLRTQHHFLLNTINHHRRSMKIWFQNSFCLLSAIFKLFTGNTSAMALLNTPRSSFITIFTSSHNIDLTLLIGYTIPKYEL